MTDLRIGGWARSGGLVGLIAAIDGTSVTLFDPADRRRAEVAATDVEVLPASAVTVRVTVDLPLPHGLDEQAVRRWVASLTDDEVRERAHAALIEAGLDEGAALPAARLEVAPVASGSVCLCGSRTPAPPGAALACPSCGRLAVGPPAAG